MFLTSRKIYKKDPQTGRKTYTSAVWYMAWYEKKMLPDGSFKIVARRKSTGQRRKREAHIVMMRSKPHITLNDSIYFDEFQKIFLQDARLDLRPSTLKIYEGTIKLFLEIIPNKPLQMYTTSDIQRYKQVRIDSFKKTNPDKKLSAASVNIELRNLKRIFNVALKAKYIYDNPCMDIKQEKVKKIRLSFSDEQIKLILENANGQLMKNIILFCLHTGCRIAEVLNLKWSNVHLQENYIEIVNTEEFRTKTSAERKIPINEELRELFYSLNIKNITNIEGYIWGRKYGKNYISRSFKRILRKLEMPEKYHLHCLRHTAISKWIKLGIPSSYVQELAGHASFNTTLNYVHSDFRAIQDKLNISYK